MPWPPTQSQVEGACGEVWGCSSWWRGQREQQHWMQGESGCLWGRGDSRKFGQSINRRVMREREQRW